MFKLVAKNDKCIFNEKNNTDDPNTAYISALDQLNTPFIYCLVLSKITQVNWFPNLTLSIAHMITLILKTCVTNEFTRNSLINDPNSLRN